MKLKLSTLAISLLTFILIAVGIAWFSNRGPHIMSETEAEECVDCVHYARRIEGMIQKMDHVPVRGNPQFFRYAMDKSCRGHLLSTGHCKNFRREFRKDVPRFMDQIQEPYEACAAIKYCY
ncbi:hypothetical protein BJY01DRAFT_230313 [Aspergillus pseudoustus]|uniref:Saposin B-type domain-containing protein n=1 Tax=Aspergillus pseudoustus TaxID=1810923 RepID=A0ABR4IDH1_9EURO